jgi:hypothetical protein
VERGSAKSASSYDEEALAATLDCYSESEEVMGWFTTLEKSLAVPFETRVLGVSVTVERIALSDV